MFTVLRTVSIIMVIDFTSTIAQFLPLTVYFIYSYWVFALWVTQTWRRLTKSKRIKSSLMIKLDS